MEFRERVEKDLAERLPKEPQFSALTHRVILSMKDYMQFQVVLTTDEYNRWCAGVNKKADPTGNEMMLNDNFIDSGDAKNFSDIFVNEQVAAWEAQEAEKKKNQAETGA